MSFSRAVIQIKPASIGTGIKCLLRKTKKSAATLSFTINVSVAKAHDIEDGCGIEVMIGEGEHHGLIRLRKNNSAPDTKAIGRETGKGAFFSVSLGHQPAFIDESHSSAWCQWEKVEDGWIEIVLPKWADLTKPKAKTTELSAVEKNARALALASATAASGMRRSVTASILGDPPPGRRQMLDEIDRMSRKKG